MKRTDIENSLKSAINQAPLVDVKDLVNIKAEKMCEHDFITSQEKQNDRYCTTKDKCTNITKKRSNIMKRRMLVTVSTLAACAIVLTGVYNNPVNYVSFDINPSVELGINAFNRVVSSEAYNDDGTLLLEENQLKNMTFEEALDTLVLEAEEQGYIMEDGSSVISVTTLSSDEETAEKMQTRCEDRIKLTLRTREIAANVYADCSNLEIRNQARESGISPGKYRLIEILRSLDSSFTVDKCRNAKISEIIAGIYDVLKAGNGIGGNGEYAGELERIRNIAQQMQGTCDDMQQNMYQGTNAGAAENNQGSQTGVAEQNQLNNQGTDTQVQEQIRNETIGYGSGEQRTLNPDQNQITDNKSESSDMEQIIGDENSSQIKIVNETDDKSRGYREN